MTILLSSTIDRTLTQWVQERLADPQPDVFWQLWCFEGVQARRAAEQQLAAQGIRARIRSSYKPLVHALLEEVQMDGLRAVELHYPVHADAANNRFLLEAYPLAAMLSHIDLKMQANTHGSGDDHYSLHLHYRGGRHQQMHVFAPNRRFETAHGGHGITPCGWERSQDSQGAFMHDAPLSTDYELAYQQAMQCIRQQPWPAGEPYFGRLHIHMELPGFEQPITGTGEVMSTPEAMHEELYFSLLEHFQHLSGRPAGDRRLQPGQMVPDIRMATGSDPLALQHISVRIESQALPLPEPLGQRAAAFAGAEAAAQAAAALEQAPSLAQIAELTQPLFDTYGTAWQGRSVQGRTIAATYKKGSNHAVLLSGGQHANEISGTHGALRGALALAARPDSHFAYIPVENPDGYALHEWYRSYAPEQMHHAARYTALGDDLEYRDSAPWYESAVRRDALAGSGAQLHLSLHGYPAHEWTRPLTGYIPQGFDLWTVPKGFFLILRYHDGWEDAAVALAEQVALALTQVPGLAAYNARQLHHYQQHSGLQPFTLRHGTPCTISAHAASPAPVTLITEFPDQTVIGDDFRLAHTAQQAAVLAAYAAWQEIMQNR
ncbi:M14 family zinc carboxypeptidase [Comamonas odontotermitis]|uniref:M14 family zinc carboxypeptidase n=2 Tax=Comamonas odontotermitis TaxID=379895 RepID=UPI001CC50EF4|nr:M14 family zinc carboxypeptidase [Comamonas odontotermitis]UBB18659.1 peptidase M14 [Comamonas odontotermitis]